MYICNQSVNIRKCKYRVFNQRFSCWMTDHSIRDCRLKSNCTIRGQSSSGKKTLGFFPKCLFPDLIVWYFLMGARFLFNTFLMHVSHQDKMISQFFLYLKTNQRRLRGALLSWRYIGTWGWTVWGKIRKGKKSSCSEKSSSEKSSVESQKGHVVAHGHVVALEGRACAWACASLREACARFCPWFAKIICSPVSGTCLAEQSKPCANLALPCSTTAFSWGPATKRKCKTCQRHSNVTLILFCLLYLFGKCPLDGFNFISRKKKGCQSLP